MDYRGIEKLHADRAAKCQAAKGANQQDGDTCQNDFRVDVAGATDHAVWNYMKRDGVKITHYMFYFVELVSGRLLQMTNADKSRTFAAIHQHAGRLYIHQATVPPGMPEPILFMQSLAWADEKGLAIRYRTIYTEGYGEWKFPARACRRTPFAISTRRSMEPSCGHRDERREATCISRPSAWRSCVAACL